MSDTTQGDQRPSPYRERRAVIVVLAAVSLVTGAFETATIIVIVALIEGVTNGDLLWEVTTGPFDLALGRTELMVVAAIALTGMTIGQLSTVRVRASAMSGWQTHTQMRLMWAYMRTDWNTQGHESSGRLQTLVNLAWGSAQGLGGAIDLLSSVGAVVIFVAAAFVASTIAAIGLLTTGVVLMLILRPLRTASRRATHQVTEHQSAVAEDVGQIHDLAQEIRLHDAADAIGSDLTEAAEHLGSSRHRAEWLTGTGSVLYRSLGLGFILVAAMIASSQAELDIARVGVAGLLLLRSLGYGQRIQQSWQRIQNARPYIAQVGDAIERYQRNTPVRGDEQPTALGVLELDQVSFSYDDEVPALHQIDLKIAPGETLGVVGPSGSGKSTLAQILLGLRQPGGGVYRAGGLRTDSIDATSWYRLVSVVPQHPRLLRASVVDNVIFYRPWISRADAEQALHDAGLDDDIAELPDGVDTVVGDARRDLSGGQRQRLGIARALAGRPEFLVLDEPTSALDALSEAKIQQTLVRLKGRITVVLIAHRLATLNHCDRLLVLEDGRVQVLDEPEVVMAQSDFYRDAVRLQLVDSDAPGT